MEQKQILVVSDGMPGHYKKTRAVTQMIRKRFPAEVTWLNVRLRLGLFRRLLRFSLNRTRRSGGNVPDPRWLKLFYRIEDPFPDEPDMIVASGGKASFVSAWLAAWHRCPLVFVGQIRGIDESYFSKLISAPLDYEANGLHIESVPATEIDEELVNEAAAAYLASTGLPQRRRWTLVLGGNGGGGYVYSRSDWRELCRTACRLASEHGIRWLITTSRRTPPHAERLFSGPEMRQWADDVLIYNHDRRDVYNAFLGCADVIVCTEDSGKMLTEAVASGRPVFAVRPPVATTNIRLMGVIHRFESAGHLQRLTIEELGTAPLPELIQQHRAPAEPLMKRVREEVDEFLWTLPWAA